MYLFKFADIGEGIHEGTILKWNFKEGDKVKEGDTLVIVETDKVNAELPSPVTGTIVKINFNVGDDLHVGDVIVEIDDGKESKKEKSSEPQEEKKEKGAGVVGEIEVSDEIIETVKEENINEETKKVLASPIARKIAATESIDINEIRGTGPQGRVLKTDVVNYQKETEFAITEDHQVSDEIEVIKVSRLRRAISKAMTTSKAMIPDTVLFDEVNVDKLVEFRNEAKLLALKEDIKLTYMAFISKAVLIALKEFPIFNSSYDAEKGEVYLKKQINLGFAVDTPDGLIVPNIKNANDLAIFPLATKIDYLATKTIERKLSLSEQQNGTFSITNFGSIGIPFGVPIINYPEVAILGIGRINKKPIVVDDSIKIGYMLPLSLGVDHRIIDGADAGRFLNKIKELLNNPTLLVLS